MDVVVYGVKPMKTNTLQPLPERSRLEVGAVWPERWAFLALSVSMHHCGRHDGSIHSRTIFFMNSVASTLNRVTGMEFNNQISVLTQHNWNTWKHDMQVLLMHYGCWQFIIQTKPEQPDEEATYKEKIRSTTS
ncbi:hypothetical protein TNCV_4177691 [Trichonephila clavipes]|nr:hypothetical protein TNCV_4177691 [Trichonephila clavipes]